MRALDEDWIQRVRQGSPMKSLGEAAKDLPWLSPCARSLAALARSPLISAWPRLKFDPGIVLLACRAWGAAPACFQPCACDVKMLRLALLNLRASNSHAGFVDWSRPDC